MSKLFGTIKTYPGFSLYIAACGLVPLLLMMHFVNLITLQRDDVGLAYMTIGLLSVVVLLGAIVFQKILMAFVPPIAMFCLVCPVLVIASGYTMFNSVIIYPTIVLSALAIVVRICASIYVALHKRLNRRRKPVAPPLGVLEGGRTRRRNYRF
jgi:hypothetical protein